MLSVWFRVFAKVAAFFVLLIFVLFFVVYGYRFDPENKVFRQYNGFLTINFWSDKNELVFSGMPYKPHERKVNIYNIEQGCYMLSYNNKERQVCIGEDEAQSDVVLTYEWKKPWYAAPSLFGVCSPLNFQEFSSHCAGKSCFASPITNAFEANGISFVKTTDTLYYCSANFESCRRLVDLSAEVVCSTEEWLILSSQEILLLK